MNAPEKLQESLVDYFPIDKLHPSPTNPREAIGDVSELATSIARMGVLQPILIRPARQAGEFEVISGHRRLVAAAEAGLEQVPCRLCEVNDEQVAEIQIVENLIVARGEQIKEALRAAGVPPVDPLDRDDDEADTPFDTQFDAYEKANRSIAAASIDKLIDSPAVWAAVAEKMLVVPAREQIKIAHMACLPEVVEYATGWQTGAREMVKAVQDPRMLRRLIAAAVLRSPSMRARILAAQAAEPVSDPSEAAQATDQTAEPAAPAKPKRARKAKAPKVGPEETPEQAGSAGVDEGAEVTNG